MKINLFLEQEWKDWLSVVLNRGQGTINSYSGSYINGILGRSTLWRQIEPLFPALCASDPVKTLAILERILQEWKDPSSTAFTNRSRLSPATVNNYGSALARYIDFLCDVMNHGMVPNVGAGVSSGAKVIWRKISLLPATSFVYSYSTLLGRLKNRLSTQDRFPVNGVYFPVRLIKKILPPKWFDAWLERYARGIRVLTKEDIFRLAELDVLEITPGGEVWVIVKGVRHRVLTETDSTGARPDPDKMQAAILDNISIDHNVPISIELASGGWKALPQLTQMIDQWRQPQGLSGFDANAVAQGVYAVFLTLPLTQQQTLIAGLKADLERIAIGPLTLMERRKNSSKGNRLGNTKSSSQGASSSKTASHGKVQ